MDRELGARDVDIGAENNAFRQIASRQQLELC